MPRVLGWRGQWLGGSGGVGVGDSPVGGPQVTSSEGALAECHGVEAKGH